MQLKIRMAAVSVFLMIWFCAFPCSGQAVDDKDREKQQEPVKPALQTRFYLQGGYVKNLADPPSGLNDYRFFDPRSNFISPDLAELRLVKEAVRGDMGFRVKLMAGDVAKKIHARGLGSPDESFDLGEIYISYHMPVGNGLKLDFGKMATFIGAEYVEALDNANYSYSNLFIYAEPVTHTGLRLSYDLSKQVNLTGYVVNGWDNFADNNGTPSLGLVLAVVPDEKVSLYCNFLNGPEQDLNTVNNRTFLEWVGSFRLSKKFSLLASYDNCIDQGGAPDGSDATWSGASLTGRYDFTDRFAFAVRGDIFNDPQGVRTGVPQTLKEVTFTPTFRVGENLFIRPEYRIDWSDVKSFNDGTSTSQSTIGIGVMLNW